MRWTPVPLMVGVWGYRDGEIGHFVDKTDMLEITFLCKCLVQSVLGRFVDFGRFFVRCLLSD